MGRVIPNRLVRTAVLAVPGAIAIRAAAIVVREADGRSWAPHKKEVTTP
ncbi:MAG TPA: hypothetical protein VG455_01045 [Acidimicrobiales bacterium]|nr:hypothetical protein [Acidimicrobiales bacterium]